MIMLYVYPKSRGYAVKICHLPYLISPCIKYYVVFYAFWQTVNVIQYQGFYGLLRDLQRSE